MPKWRSTSCPASGRPAGPVLAQNPEAVVEAVEANVLLLLLGFKGHAACIPFQDKVCSQDEDAG